MVVESCVFIGRTIGVNCEQMMEFASKNQKGKPPTNGFALIEKRYHNNFKALIFTFS
jgi:hypothetical protein